MKILPLRSAYPLRRPRLWRGLLLAAGLLALVLFAAPYLLAPDTVRKAVSDKIMAYTGLPARVENVSLAFGFPTPVYVLHQLRVAGSDGLGDVLIAPRATLKLGFFAWDRRVRELNLHEPRVQLIALEDGRSNWRSIYERLRRLDQDLGRVPALGRVRLYNAQLFWGRREGDMQRLAQAVDLAVHWSDPHGRLSVNLAGPLNGRRVQVEAALQMPLAVMQRSISAFTARLNGEALDVKMSGNVLAKEGLRAEADVRWSAGSLERFADWLLPRDITAFLPGAAQGQAQLRYDDSTLLLDQVKMTIGDTRGEGFMAVKMKEPRPNLQGTLDLDAVDLRPMFISALPFDTAQAQRSFLRVDPQRLHAIDLDMRLSIGKLNLARTSMEAVALSVLARDKRFEISLGDGRYFGGQVSGRAIVERLGESALRASLAASANDVAMDEALRELFGFVRLSGKGSLNMTLQGEGAHLAGAFQALQGEATVRLSDAMLMGLDLAALGANPQRQALGVLKNTPGQRSAINSGSARFVVRDGVATTNDAHMQGDGYGLDVRGNVDLQAAHVDFSGYLHPPVPDPAVPPLPFAWRGSWHQLAVTGP